MITVNLENHLQAYVQTHPKKDGHSKELSHHSADMNKNNDNEGNTSKSNNVVDVDAGEEVTDLERRRRERRERREKAAEELVCG